MIGEDWIKTVSHGHCSGSTILKKDYADWEIPIIIIINFTLLIIYCQPFVLHHP